MPGLVKVTVAPIATRLTTLAAARTQCDTTDDITTLIDRASAVIASHCGRAFGLQTVQETFRLSHHSYLNTHRHRRVAPLVLQYAPTSLTSVTEDGTALTVDVDYELDGQLLHRLCDVYRREWCATPVVAVYTTGWVLPESVSPAPNLPADVEAACLALVGSAFAAQGGDPNVSLDRTQDVGELRYFDRSVNSLVIDEGLIDILSPYVVRVW